MFGCWRLNEWLDMESLRRLVRLIILVEWLGLGGVCLGAPSRCTPCYCTETVMQCTGSNTTYIPRPPNDVRAVTLSRYNLTVGVASLSNLTGQDTYVTNFVMESCVIQNITDDAFVNFINLEDATISKCTVSVEYLRHGIVSLAGLRHLRTLTLDGLSLSGLPPDFFYALNASGLQILKLAETDLRSHDVFVNGVSGGTGSIFRGLNKLKTLNLVNNRLEDIPSNAFSDVATLEVLHLENNPIRHLGDLAFNLPTILRLYLRSNGLDFSTIDTSRVFGQCPTLQLLDLTDNDLSRLNDSALGRMFSASLTDLQTLFLTSTKIQTIPTETFQNLPSLRLLSLENNSIASWSAKIFDGLGKLETLNMSRNRITSIDETLLPQSLIEHLKSIDFSFNPFSCNCDLLWFREWLDKSKVKVHEYPSGYKCQSPQDLSGKLISSWTASSADCDQPGGVTDRSADVVLVVGTLVGGLILVTVIITLIVYREHIREKLQTSPRLNVYYKMYPES